MEEYEYIRGRIKSLEDELASLKKKMACADRVTNLRNKRNEFFADKLHIGHPHSSCLGNAMLTLIREVLDYKDIRTLDNADMWDAISDMQDDLLPIVRKYYERRREIQQPLHESLLLEYQDKVNDYKACHREDIDIRVKRDEIIALSRRLESLGYSREHLRSYW